MYANNALTAFDYLPVIQIQRLIIYGIKIFFVDIDYPFDVGKKTYRP